MKKLITPFKVGLLTIIVVVASFMALRTVEQGALGSGGTYRLHAVLDNVLGVAKRSRVVMAGIDVGYIESIDLVEGRARLNLRIRNDVTLYRDASLAKVSESLLGDKIIDLSPGSDKQHPLKDGDYIRNVYEEKDFSEIFRTLDGITRDINSVTTSLRRTLGQLDRQDSLGGVMARMNEIADNVATLSREINDTFHTGRAKIEGILDDVAGISSGTRGRYKEILENIRVVSEQMKTLVQNLNGIVGRGEGDLKQSVSDVRRTLDKAHSALERLDNLVAKVERGEGSIGRLVTEDTTLDKVEGVIDDVTSITRPLSRLKIDVDLRSEYHVNQNAAKNYLSFRLMPRPDKYYMFELIDDPRGKVDVVETCVGTETCPEDQRQKEIRITDDLKWSLQFAKRLYFAAFRFGIIEGTGGVGLDFYFFDDDLQLRFDLFQFGKNEFGVEALPRLKAMLVYRPSWLARHVYFAAGGDDFFNRDVFDYFFGAGISFTDRDLKAILYTTGVPTP
ncbi:MAG: MCE family protein [Deltaproteobacteria bacterium]|nr:MAG: MCE family protein [Deltaproteobacteria bacterium]